VINAIPRTAFKNHNKHSVFSAEFTAGDYTDRIIERKSFDRSIEEKTSLESSQPTIRNTLGDSVYI
jgi:hypothetical protein